MKNNTKKGRKEGNSLILSSSVKSGVLDQTMADFIQVSTLASSMDGFEATWNLESAHQHLQQIQDSLLCVKEATLFFLEGMDRLQEKTISQLLPNSTDLVISRQLGILLTLPTTLSSICRASLRQPGRL